MRTASIALFLLNVFYLPATSAQQYSKTGECEDRGRCLYSYEVDSVVPRMLNLSLSITIEVSCCSVGTLEDGTSATQYCFKIIPGQEDEIVLNDEIITSSHHDLNHSDSNFCFVQTEHGAIVAVQYDNSSVPTAEALNLKKAIAAAFQADFKCSDNRVSVEEGDAHSRHFSKYSYYTCSENNFHMSRTVTEKDILPEHHTHDYQVLQKEEVRYSEGRLVHSNGTFNVGAPSSWERAPSSIQGAFFGHSDGVISYSGYRLTLKKCLRNKRRGIKLSQTPATLVDDDIYAVHEKKQSELDQLRSLWNEVNVPVALSHILTNSSNSTSATGMLRQLLVLESVYGPKAGSQPALLYVVDAYHKIPSSNKALREVMFSLFLAEGSLTSQHIILDALESSQSIAEKHFLVNCVAFFKTSHAEIVQRVVKMINSSSGDERDALLLAYSAFSSSLPENLKQSSVHFLIQRLNHSKLLGDTKGFNILVHTLGNTNSSEVVDTLVGLLTHDSLDIKKAALYALRHNLHEEKVYQLIDGLLKASDHSGELADVTLRAMIAKEEWGHTSRYGQKKDPTPQYQVTLLQTIGSKLPQDHSLLKRYEQEYRMMQSKWQKRSLLHDHTAIWSKRIVGNDEINIELSQPESSSYGISANIFKFSFTFMTMKVSSTGQVYVSLGGNVLLAKMTFPETKLQVFQRSIFTSIGFLTFSINAYAKLTIDVNVGSDITIVTPKLTLRLEGDGSHSVLAIRRYGATLSGEVVAALEVQQHIRCSQVSASNPENSIELYVYQQKPTSFSVSSLIRTITSDGEAWWGPKEKCEEASKKWSFPGLGQKQLHNSCQ